MATRRPDQGAREVRWRFGSFSLLERQRRVERAGQAVKLGPRSFDLLRLLVQRAGEFVGNEDLLSIVWAGVVVEGGSVRVQMSALRKALGEPDGADGCREWISNVPLRGYRFNGRVLREVLDPSSGSWVEGSPPSEIDAAPAAPPPVRRHNLPHPLTSFIGRENDIEQLKALLASRRLVTLTGAGGCGKTRLALQVAGEMVDEFADGCTLVELAPLGESTLLARSVASALFVDEQPGQDLTEAAARWLEAKHLLLVLDNAEHLLGACAELADELLRRCARLAILVTSRERLGIIGESNWRVPSLSLPDTGQEATPERIMACESARLFIERARLQARFSLTPENAPAVASICHRLDGIPLAIELAAARLRSMSLNEVSERLDERFTLLTGGSRTALPRHRTLRSLIDWSYDHLGETERMLLRRVSVFAGGWTLEAAEQVCTDKGKGSLRVLDLLTALVDKSLVWAHDHEGATRYGVLETVRHYARDRLHDSGEALHIQRRHFSWCLDFAKRARTHLGGPQELMWIASLEAEHDNLRSALAWTLATREATSGLRLANLLNRFWGSHGHVGEGRGWFGRLIAASTGEPATPERAWALVASGSMAFLQADYPAAQGAYDAGRSMHRALGDRFGAAHALSGLAIIAQTQCDFAKARALWDEALGLFQQVGDREGVACALMNLGEVARRLEDFKTARRSLEEALAIGRELGDRRYIANPLMFLGLLAHCEDRLPEARTLLESSLSNHRQAGDAAGVADALTTLSMVQLDEGDCRAAQVGLEEALRIADQQGNRFEAVNALERYAAVLCVLCDVIAAARLWGCGTRLREELGSPMEMNELRWINHRISMARVALGDDAAFDAAWQAGRAMALEQATQYALGIGAGRLCAG